MAISLYRKHVPGLSAAGARQGTVFIPSPKGSPAVPCGWLHTEPKGEEAQLRSHISYRPSPTHPISCMQVFLSVFVLQLFITSASYFMDYSASVLVLASCIMHAPESVLMGGTKDTKHVSHLYASD